MEGGGLIAKETWSRWTDITPGRFCFLLFYPVIAVVALAVGASAVKWAWVKQPEAGSHSTTTGPLAPCHVLCFLARARVLF